MSATLRALIPRATLSGVPTRGPQTVALPAIVVEASVLTPTLAAAARSLSLPLIVVEADVYSPSLTAAAAQLHLPAIVVESLVVPPSVVRAANALSLPIVTVEAVVNVPAINIAAVSVALPAVLVEAVARAPVVASAAGAVTLPLCTVEAVVYAPTVVETSYDADAQSYIDAITAASYSWSAGEQDAVNAYFLAGKANGWWAKRGRCIITTYGLAGANAIDISLSGGISFVGGGWTHAADYVQGNGSTDYINLGALMTDLASLASGSLMVYAHGDTASDYDMGVQSGSNTGRLMVRLSTTGYFDWGAVGSGGRVSGSVSDSRGLWLGNRSAGKRTLYRRTQAASTVTIGEITNSDVGSLPALTAFAAAQNNGGSASNFSDRPYSLIWAGAGLTDAEAASLLSDTETLLDSLGAVVL